MNKKRIDARALCREIQEQTSIPSPKLPEDGVVIKDSIITGDVVLGDLGAPLVFSDCVFKDNLAIYRKRDDQSILFLRCYFLRVTLDECNINATVAFRQCEVLESFILSDGKIDKLQFLPSICKRIILADADIRHIELGQYDQGIELLSIQNTKAFEGELQISDIGIENIRIGASNISGSIKMYNIEVGSILFNRIKNNGTMKIVNLNVMENRKARSFFTVYESNLGKAEFFQVNFSLFDELNIIDSILIECLFINTKWTNNINSFQGIQMDYYMEDRMPRTGIGYELEKAKIRFKRLFGPAEVLSPYRETIYQTANRREVFKQIKFALSKQGDYIHEQYLHGLEMNVYNKTLGWNVKFFFTKAILYLSRFTSNYGQSMVRPLFFLLAVNGSLFLWLVLRDKINGVHIVAPSLSTVDGVGNAVAAFLRYLSPIRKNEDELKGWWLVIDYCMRIISSYSIYNLIRASRRFIK